MLYLLLLLPLFTLLGRKEARVLPALVVGTALLSVALALGLLGRAEGPFRLDGVGLFYLLLTDLL